MVATIKGIGNTSSSLSLRFEGLTYQASTYYLLELKCNQTGETVNLNSGTAGTAGDYYSVSKTFIGLSSGTTYTFTGRAQWQSTNSITTLNTSYTTLPAPTPADTPRVVASGRSSDGLTVYWDIYTGNNTTGIYINRDWSTEIYTSMGSNSSYTFSYTGTSYNTSYGINVQATGSGGMSSYYGWVYNSTGSPPTPSQPSISAGASGRTINYSITTGSNTSRIVVNASWDGGTTILNTSVSSNTTYNFSVTAPSYNTTYTLSVTPSNSYGSGTPNTTSVKTGADNIAPTISMTVTDRYNGISVSLSSTDDSGVFRDPKYSLYISGENNSTLTFVGTTNSSTYTFVSDGNGGLLMTDSQYLVRVYVYDSAGNSAYAQEYVIVKRLKPALFSWTNAKTSGGSFNVLATEWNGLTYRVNEFRQYRGYNNYSFSNVSAGIDFKAEYFNQVINGISPLRYTGSLPSIKAKGDTVYASELNRLRDALNSVE